MGEKPPENKQEKRETHFQKHHKSFVSGARFELGTGAVATSVAGIATGLVWLLYGFTPVGMITAGALAGATAYFKTRFAE